MNDEQKLDLWEDFSQWIDNYPTDCQQIELIGNVLECCIKFLIAESCCSETAIMRSANINKLLAITLVDSLDKEQTC